MIHQIVQVFTDIKLYGHCRETHLRGQEFNRKVREEQQGLKLVHQGIYDLHQGTPTLGAGKYQGVRRSQNFRLEVLLVVPRKFHRKKTNGTDTSQNIPLSTEKPCQ